MMFNDQKTQEISLVLIKISVYVRRPELRHRLEKLGFDLLESVAGRDFIRVSEVTRTIESLVMFGKSIYEIEPINADYIIDQVRKFNSAIRQIAELSLPDLENPTSNRGIVEKPQDNLKKSAHTVRSRASALIPQTNNSNEHRFNEDKNVAEKVNFAENQEIRSGFNGAKISVDDNPANRQSEIVDKIRQSGNNQIQLKDIIAAFPDFSDRTIRYDLQRLCNQGIIERIGSGGPGTHYRIRII